MENARKSSLRHCQPPSIAQQQPKTKPGVAVGREDDMETRYHMQKQGLMVEHHFKVTLEHIRKLDKRFKGARIKSVLQAYPSKIKTGVIYELGKAVA